VRHAGRHFDELLANLDEAIEACLSVDVNDVELAATDSVVEIAL